MLTANDIKEELSLAYVRAVASRAGFSVEERRKDRGDLQRGRRVHWVREAAGFGVVGA